MKSILITVLIVFLSGCTTIPKIEQVYIPVATKCNDKPIPDKPKLFIDNFIGNEKINEIINGYQTDINKLEVYADDLKVLICK